MSSTSFTEEFNRFITTSSQAISRVRASIRLASWHHIILVLGGIIFTIMGQSGQILALNFWLAKFPSEYQGYSVGGPLSVLLAASLFLFVSFFAILLFHLFRKRPSLAFISNPAVWGYGIASGVMMALNGFMIVYATPHVSEIIQSILTSFVIIWSFVFAVVFKVNNGKNYCHILVLLAVVFSMAGIILGTLSTHSSGGDYQDQAIWASLFALAGLPGALCNVLGAKFLQTCAYDDEAHDEKVKQEEERKWNERNTPSVSPMEGVLSNNNNNHAEGGSFTALPDPAINNNEASPLLGASSTTTPTRPQQQQNPNNNINKEGTQSLLKSPSSLSNLSARSGDSSSSYQRRKMSRRKKMTENGQFMRADMGTAKNMFLAIGTLAQFITFMICIPVDATPWFGDNPGNVTAAFESAKSGCLCSINALPDVPSIGDACKESSKYYYLFSAAFVCATAGSLIVSQFSPNLAALSAQIAAPLTTVLLISAPSLAPKEEDANILMCVFAVILIILGSLLYGFWEQMTSQQQRDASTKNPYAESGSEEDEDVEEEEVNENNNNNNEV